MLGRFPKLELLKKYRLTQFIEIIRAVKSGDIKTFDESLAEHQAFFIQRGVYVIVEKLRTLAWRNLFKKVYAFNLLMQLTT